MSYLASPYISANYFAPLYFGMGSNNSGTYNFNPAIIVTAVVPDYIISYVKPASPYEAGDQRVVTYTLTSSQGIVPISVAAAALIFVDPTGVNNYSLAYTSLSIDEKTMTLSFWVEFKISGIYQMRCEITDNPPIGAPTQVITCENVISLIDVDSPVPSYIFPFSSNQTLT